MQFVGKFLVAVALELERIAGIVLIAIACIVTLDVLSRAVTGSPITGVFEISGLMLVAVTMLALPAVLLRQKHLRVDIALEQAGPRATRALQALDIAVGLGVLGLLMNVAAHDSVEAFQRGYLVNGMISIPTWIPYLTIAVGTAGGIMVLALQAAGLVTGRDIAVPPLDTEPDLKEL